MALPPTILLICHSIAGQWIFFKVETEICADGTLVRSRAHCHSTLNTAPGVSRCLAERKATEDLNFVLTTIWKLQCKWAGV